MARLSERTHADIRQPGACRVRDLRSRILPPSGAVRISTGNGSAPIWSPNGGVLYYSRPGKGGERTLIAVDMENGRPLIGRPQRELFTGTWPSSTAFARMTLPPCAAVPPQQRQRTACSGDLADQYCLALGRRASIAGAPEISVLPYVDANRSPSPPRVRAANSANVDRRLRGAPYVVPGHVGAHLVLWSCPTLNAAMLNDCLRL
jgi:hypothetical protein